MLQIDILKMTPCRGYKYLFTAIDRYSSYLFAIPLKEMNAESVIKVLLYEILPFTGVPDKILSDNGGCFKAHLFEEVCKMIGAEHICTTVGSPQVNGNLENRHRVLLSSLRCMLSENEFKHHDWVSVLPFALFAIRTSPLNENGITASQVLFGQNVNIPGRLVDTERPGEAMCYDKYLNKLAGLFAQPLAPRATLKNRSVSVSYTHLRAHETPEHLVCRLLLEKKK